MKVEIIKVNQKRINGKPNLQNYAKVAKNFKWDSVKKEIAWFDDGKLNAAYNAIDKHVPIWEKNKVALYWENEEGKKKEYSFLDISERSNKLANVLKDLGVKKGDRCFIFLPRIPELYISFIGILKTGAIAGTMFSAFGPDGIKDRLGDSEAKVLITDSLLVDRLYEVAKDLPALEYVIIVNKTGKKLNEKKFKFKEIDYHASVDNASDKFKIAHMKPKDPAFMLYTSGTTGKPKGVVHGHLAVLTEHMTAKWVLDIKPEDVYWCTADPGWVTGIAYEILGTWSNGASSVIYEGRFDASRWYKIIQDKKVTIWYTAPTAIRLLAAAGNVYKKYDLSTLRHLCSVGEPLNPEPIRWGMKALKLPFHDNYWQTESGGMLVANYPCMDIKLGSMGRPIPGINAQIIDDKGKILKNNQIGNVAIKPGWPSMMLKIWKNKKKYNSYFHNGWYITGDLGYMDKDGYLWFIGRADDVIKTSGERVGPFEVESALIEHPSVIESGVIGKPDPEGIRGEIIKAFVVLKPGIIGSKQLEDELKNLVKKKLAGHAYPREIAFVDKLPKTRSGKIMRRMLKAKELGLPIGDTSTLEND
ncbi:MAG: acetate--CoA ligase [archaeon]